MDIESIAKLHTGRSMAPRPLPYCCYGHRRTSLYIREWMSTELFINIDGLKSIISHSKLEPTNKRSLINRKNGNNNVDYFLIGRGRGNGITRRASPVTTLPTTPVHHPAFVKNSVSIEFRRAIYDLLSLYVVWVND